MKENKDVLIHDLISLNSVSWDSANVSEAYYQSD